MFNIMVVELKHSINSQGSERTSNRIQHSQNGSPGLTPRGSFTMGQGGGLRRAQRSKGFQDILIHSQI